MMAAEPPPQPFLYPAALAAGRSDAPLRMLRDRSRSLSVIE